MLEFHRKQAKALVRSHRAGDDAALARARAVLGDHARFQLSDALHVVAVEAGHRSWPAFVAAGAEVLTFGVQYAPGHPVRVHHRRRGTRHDFDDGGAAVALAGRPPGWLAAAQRAVELEWLNVNRAGVVFVQGQEGRDLDRLARKVAAASRDVYVALLELEE